MAEALLVLIVWCFVGPMLAAFLIDPFKVNNIENFKLQYFVLFIGGPSIWFIILLLILIAKIEGEPKK